MPDGPASHNPVRSSATINKTGDRIYFGANDGKVYCLNVSGASPVQLWTYNARPNSTIESTPALDSLTGSELYVSTPR